MTTVHSGSVDYSEQSGVCKEMLLFIFFKSCFFFSTKSIHLHCVGVEAPEISDMFLKIWASKTKEREAKSSSLTPNDGPKK